MFFCFVMTTLFLICLDTDPGGSPGRAVQAAEPSGLQAREASARPECNPKNTVGYVSKERCEFCVEGEGCFNAIPLVEKSQREALRGSLSAAIKTMEEAVLIINSYRIGRIQRWDNLAELYCLRALEEPDSKRAAHLRSDGVAMLNEFRCGVEIQKGKRACALNNARNKAPEEDTKWGFVPDSRLTPMCYTSFCDDGFQRDLADSFSKEPDPSGRAEWEAHYEEFDAIDDDAANIAEIETLCRRGAKK